MHHEINELLNNLELYIGVIIGGFHLNCNIIPSIIICFKIPYIVKSDVLVYKGVLSKLNESIGS